MGVISYRSWSVDVHPTPDRKQLIISYTGGRENLQPAQPTACQCRQTNRCLGRAPLNITSNHEFLAYRRWTVGVFRLISLPRCSAIDLLCSASTENPGTVLNLLEPLAWSMRLAITILIGNFMGSGHLSGRLEGPAVPCVV